VLGGARHFGGNERGTCSLLKGRETDGSALTHGTRTLFNSGKISRRAVLAFAIVIQCKLSQMRQGLLWMRAHNNRVPNPTSRFTSMFVERMEVLEYRQKFEVGLSTFPDSTNTKTPRKLVFSLTVSACLSVCMSVRKSLLLVNILRKSWPIWMKILVYVAIGLKSRTSPNQYNPVPIFPSNFEGGWFLQFLNPISKNR